jgi:chorismate synthase
MAKKYRPSHADYTYDAKYGIRNWQGGGRASARETIGRVAAAAIAKKVLRERFAPDLEIIAYVKSVRDIEANVDPETVQFETVESNMVRTGDPEAVEAMIELIKAMRSEGNSVGGIVECVVRGVPAGLGEPVFDKLDADLAKKLRANDTDKLRLINFWATWCGPCIAEMPDLERVHADRGDEVRFIGINTQDDLADAQALAEQTGVTYELGFDPDGALFSDFEVVAMPSTFFIDAAGGIVHRHAGLMTEQQLRDLIDEHLGS